MRGDLKIVRYKARNGTIPDGFYNVDVLQASDPWHEETSTNKKKSIVIKFRSGIYIYIFFTYPQIPSL